MPHNYKKMPPLWYLEELFELSNDYDSGLSWATKQSRYKKGDAVGTKNKSNGYYFVSIDNSSYMVHRIVYYLRMGIAPDAHSVQHLGETKDNRTPLIETYKTPSNKKIMASGFKL